MKNTLFVQLLKKLPPNQLRKLVSFAESKYHNSHDATSRLISQIVSTAPRFSENQLDKRLIWKKIYPNKPFKELSYNNLVSDALRVSYDFLSLENWSSKQDEYYDNLAEALIDLGLYDQANRNLKRWRKTKEKQNLDSAERQMGNYRWFEHQDQIAILQKRRYSDYLQQKNDALDQYFLQNKLQIACAMASRSRIVQGTYQNDLLSPLIQHFQLSSPDNDKVDNAAIYWATYQLLQEENPQIHFQWLKDQLQKQSHQFSAKELNGLYQYLINYCIRKINGGDASFYREVLQLYQIQLQQGILLKGGEMTEWTYANIITTSLRLREFDWAEAFIEKYRDYLPKGKQYNVYHYNLAALRLAQGEDDKALQQLLEVEFTDAFYYVAAKIILLKIYYRQGAYEALLSQSESARIYLMRNRQLADNQRKSNRKFLRFLVKIAQLQQKKDQFKKEDFNKKSQRIFDELSATSGVSNRSWLVEILTK